MKVWNIVLYVGIFCLAVSVLAQCTPFIFPDQSEMIQSALPSVDRVTKAMEDFTNATGTLTSAQDAGTVLLGLGETFINGFTFMVTFFTATITCIPDMFSFLGVPQPVSIIIGAFTTILYVMIGIAILQLITGRTFLQIE